jgi:glycosyltransferase involved in cell wall biosynthesis
MKVVIVMTYYDRERQLRNTLRSIARTKHDNYEVIVVDDGSPEPLDIKLAGVPLTILRTTRKHWTNPEPAYNTGLYYASLRKPDVLILQNAECYHVSDIVRHAATVREDEYFSYACFSLDYETTFRTHDINAVIAGDDHGASRDGQNAWYNHPVHRPVAYDFCSAMRWHNMLLLNGYDERFSDGCGYGDDYLLHRIKLLGLRVDIPTMPFVVHQWHYNTTPPANKAELVARNHALFYQCQRENKVRAQHIYTQDITDHAAENPAC